MAINFNLELSDNTLGGAYWSYVNTNGFSPDERTAVRFMMDEELAYIMTRYRQIHDFWHVLAELPPTLLGEIALKAFEFKVSSSPLPIELFLYYALRKR